jgi:hypothetical protein
MFGTIAGGLLVGPWLGVWDIAWQQPATGLSLLASLLLATVAGFVLMAEGSRRKRLFAAGTIQVRPAAAPPDPAARSADDDTTHVA